MIPDFNNNMMNNILIEQMQNMMMNMEMNKMNNTEVDKGELEFQEKEKKRKSYYSSKIYEIDFKRIKRQNEDFKLITKRLLKYIKNLEECIKNNNKIMDDYIENPFKIKNYTNLLELSCSIEDIYEDKIRDFKLDNNEISNIFKLGIKNLKDNYIDNFNKKYNTNLRENKAYVGFRDFLDEGNYDLHILDEVKFKELCRINFNNINDLEIKFEDNININVLLKASYVNLSFLGLIGKIKDINILKQLPFKSLKTLFLSKNNFDKNIDIFRNVPFQNLKRIILSGNNISNIEGLSNAPFYELTTLELNSNCISDIKPLQRFPFKKLEILNLGSNNIENIDCLSNVPFLNLITLILSYNNIKDINVLSMVKFHNLQSLNLRNNQIKNIEIFSKVPFNDLTYLDLRDNLINNINVLNKVPFVKLELLELSSNKINNFDVLYNTPFKNRLIIHVDNRQNCFINKDLYFNSQNIQIIISE